MPLSTSTASEKLRIILLVVATAVALSAGEEELKEGLVSSDLSVTLKYTLSSRFKLSLSVDLTIT